MHEVGAGHDTLSKLASRPGEGAPASVQCVPSYVCARTWRSPALLVPTTTHVVVLGHDRSEAHVFIPVPASFVSVPSSQRSNRPAERPGAMKRLPVMKHVVVVGHATADNANGFV